MQCPSCEMNELKESRSEKMGIKVNFCPNCNGLWISGEDARKILGGEEADFSLHDSRRPYSVYCPKCKKTLHAWLFPYMEAEVGICAQCNGMWVEGRNLKKFFQAIKSLREYGVPADYKKRKGFFSRLIGNVLS